MGMHDRTYWKDEPTGVQSAYSQYGRGGGGGGTFGGLPKPGLGVKWLLIINVIVFFGQLISGDLRTNTTGFLTRWLAAVPADYWQGWRYLTFQFLHGGLFHLLFNMLGLYFLGTHLERSWGTKRFLRFYLICGAVAGLAHVGLMQLFGNAMEQNTPLIGASGGVYAVILACAILFPQIRLILLFFPVPIRLAATLFFVIAAVQILIGIQEGQFAGTVSHAAHFGGMLAGGVWVWLLPRVHQAARESKPKRQHGAWQRKLRKQQQLEAEVDRILEKIRHDGIGALSAKEKRTLKEATARQRREDQKSGL